LSLFRKTRTTIEQPLSDEDLLPTTPFFAVGDLHGCQPSLRSLLTKLDAHAAGEETLVFLGDAIDRGPSSNEVLSTLFELQSSHPERVVCLMGNHERMMLNFIDDPAGEGLTWLWNGGLETLSSYGILLRTRDTDAGSYVEIANALEKALPAGLQDWLRGLPLSWSSGNLHCVHAAMSPHRQPEAQRSEVLLWGHPDFLSTAREDDHVAVHGHTIVREPKKINSRIAVDTGAYRTGCLTAAYVSHGTCEFIQTFS
jgi:serine/threonine protein phosphatase 1